MFAWTFYLSTRSGGWNDKFFLLYIYLHSPITHFNLYRSNQMENVYRDLENSK